MNNMNWFAVVLGLNNLKKNGITDSSEKSKAVFFPMLVKDPMASMVTVDLSTKKAVETKKANTLAAENIQLAAATDAALTVVKEYKLSANRLRDVISQKSNEGGLDDNFKKFLKEEVLESGVFKLAVTDEVRDAIVAVRPDLRPEKLDGEVDLAVIKDLLKEA